MTSTPKDRCDTCGRPLDVGDDVVRLGASKVHGGCTVPCPYCDGAPLYAARAIEQHVAFSHPVRAQLNKQAEDEGMGVTFAPEDEGKAADRFVVTPTAGGSSALGGGNGGSRERTNVHAADGARTRTPLHEANVERHAETLGTARQAVLDEAGRIIASDRNATYGEPEDNLGRIAGLWSVYLERRVSPRDVAWLMVLLKVAREVHGPHDDNPVDVCGYAAIAGEVSA